MMNATHASRSKTLAATACALALACSSGSGGGSTSPDGGQNLDPPAVDMTGPWATYVEMPQSSILIDEVSISQSGNDVTASFASAGSTLHGTLSGNALRLQGTLSLEGGSVTVTLSGAPSEDGTLVTGTFQDASGSSRFAAIKKVAPAANIAGRWMVYPRLPGDGTKITVSELAVTQNGSSLAATRSIDTYAGAIHGSRFVLYQYGYDNVFHGGGHLPLYLGTVDGSAALSGSLYGDGAAASGTWRANKPALGTVSAGTPAIAIPPPQPIAVPGPIPPVPIQLNYELLTFDGDTSRYWLADYGGKVYRVDTSTGSASQVSTLPSVPRRLTYDGSHFWYSDDGGTVRQMDASWNVVGAPLPLDFLQLSSILAFDGSHLWVFTNDTLDLVREVDLSGYVVSALLGPSQDVRGMTYDGKSLLLGVHGLPGDTIYAFDAALDTVTAVYAFGDTSHQISGLVFDGKDVWCIDATAGLVHPLTFATGP